ncbi:IS110 family transposase [Pseudonocardia ailaonensis]|uniref:IS110 family transposase n=1 Tax=Pseudonocardia ailaonensis TaxID=367279 RepID=A0ABN2NC90_9PSEU
MAGKKLWVGIDVGESAHHACAVDDHGKIVFSRKVTNTQAAIEDLITRTTTKAGQAGEVVWAVDMTSGSAALLVALLQGSGHRLLSVPGRLVNRMAGAFTGEGKTDAKDARTIAETARLRADLAEVAVPDQITGDLQVLTARREDLMADWVRGVNRLRELLGSIFPGLEQAFDYTTRSALILVSGYQTPAELRVAGVEQVEGFLAAQRSWAPGRAAMAATAVTVAGEQSLALPGESVTAPLIARLARQLLDLDRETKDLDKLLGARFVEHPQAEIITSIDGFGPILGAELLADTGGNLVAAFGTSSRLAAYAGLAPVPRDSGRIRGNLHRPKRYHRGLRRVFYMAALSSLKRADSRSRAFYDKKRAEGKRHVQALIALARRLVDLVWALLRDNRPFTTEAPAPTATAA